MLNVWEIITSRQRVFTEDLLQNALYRKMRGESGGGGEHDVTITSTPPLYLPYSLGYNLADWSITGNTVQDGEPTPENPVDVQGVGEWDAATQKYKIPVVTRGTDGAETATNIYLDSPLMTGETVSSDGSREVEWGIKVFTGNEMISNQQSQTEGYTTAYFVLNKEDVPVSSELGFCSHFPNKALWNNDVEGFQIRRTQAQFLRFRISKVKASDADEFRRYLTEQYNAGTPVTVYYQLATPTTSTIAPPNIPTTTGTCVLDVDTSVQPSSMTATYKSSVPDNDMADMISLLAEI